MSNFRGYGNTLEGAWGPVKGQVVVRSSMLDEYGSSALA